VHGSIRDHNEELKIKDEIRKFEKRDTIMDEIKTIFAQYTATR